jgi:hypothetical protein
MKLFDRHNRMRERALAIITLRGRDAPGAPPSAPDGDRLLIRFSYPNDIRGTGFLVWEHPNSDDERFLYLPSLGRVRRIAGAETQESFVGSDFTYEDIGGREFDDYSYLPTRRAPDPARRARPPAWWLEARRRGRVSTRRLDRAQGQLVVVADSQPAQRKAEDLGAALEREASDVVMESDASQKTAPSSSSSPGLRVG